MICLAQIPCLLILATHHVKTTIIYLLGHCAAGISPLAEEFVFDIYSMLNESTDKEFAGRERFILQRFW